MRSGSILARPTETTLPFPPSPSAALAVPQQTLLSYCSTDWAIQNGNYVCFGAGGFEDYNIPAATYLAPLIKKQI